MLAIEQEFGIQFTPEEMEQLVSVARIAECLDRKYPPAGNHV
jgi:acyl carrier protein